MRSASIQRSFQSRRERYERLGAAGFSAKRAQARSETDTAETPAGPPIAFWAPITHRSTPHASGSSASAPTDATASSMNSAPWARTASPISATGFVLPVAASAWTRETKSISGCSARARATWSAVTAVSNGTARSTTFAPQSRSQLPKVVPYGPVTTFSAVEPGRAPERMHPSSGSSASPWVITTSSRVPSRSATPCSICAKRSAVSGGRSRRGWFTGVLSSSGASRPGRAG